MKKLTLILILLGLNTALFAEMRVWQDAKGSEYNAEFVREMFDKVTLRQEDGSEIRLSVDELSEHDQKYLRVMVPPVMAVNVTKSSYRKSKQYDDQYDMDRDETTVLSLTVDITKESNRPFTSRLFAELYIIAEEVVDSDYYVLISKTDTSFLLGDHNENSYRFQSEPVELKVYQDYDRQRKGHAYLGYVVAIYDVQKDLVQVATDIDWLQNKIPELRDLYERGKASRYSRYFDKETVTKQPVPRPKDFAGRM